MAPRLRKGIDVRQMPLSSSKRPKCKKHQLSMQWNIERSVFFCPTEGCNSYAWPKDEVLEKPVVGTGKLQLIVSEEQGKIWLRAENNVVIELAWTSPTLIVNAPTWVHDAIKKFQTTDGKDAWWMKIFATEVLDLDATGRG